VPRPSRGWPAIERDPCEAAKRLSPRRAFRKPSEFPNRRHSNCCGRPSSHCSRLTQRYRARHRQKLPRGGSPSPRKSVAITKWNGHQNVEVRHFGISRVGCRELRDNRTTPERDTRTTPQRDTRSTPERDTRTTPERDTRTTPETHRRGSETNCRGAGTYCRADATRSGPRLHVCGPYTGHRRPFSLHYESLPARVEAKGSSGRCITKARAALTDCTTRFGNIANCYPRPAVG
jgi:hypothetical protein